MGSAGSQLQAADRSAAPDLNRELRRLQWAAPDLNQGTADCSGQRRASPGGSWAEWASPGGRARWAAPDLTVQKKNVRKERQQKDKECQKICQKRMSEKVRKNVSIERSPLNSRRL